MRLTILSVSLASDWHNPMARGLRGLLRALEARGHEVLIWEPAANPSLRAELRACGAAPLRAFAARYGDLQRHTFPAMQGQDLTLWLSRTLATTEVCLVDARLPAELVRKVGQLTAAGLVTLLHDATGAVLAGGAAWWSATGVAGYSAILAGSAALAERYRALGSERVVIFMPSAEPAAVALATAPDFDVVLLGEGVGDTPALLALAGVARLLPHRSFLLAGDGDDGDGVEAVQAAGIEREPPCGRRRPEAIYPLARLALHVPARPLGVSARPLEALACHTPVVILDSEAAASLDPEAGTVTAVSAGDLAAAVERLLADEPARRALAARGHAAVLARHTGAARAAELEALITPLLARS